MAGQEQTGSRSASRPTWAPGASWTAHDLASHRAAAPAERARYKPVATGSSSATTDSDDRDPAGGGGLIRHRGGRPASSDFGGGIARDEPVASHPVAGPPSALAVRQRYLVADRMDITGARWSVSGAGAILTLRAIRANDDFDEY